MKVQMKSVMVSAVLLASVQGFGATTAARCSRDSLAPAEALQRNSYIRACFPEVIWKHSSLLKGSRPATYAEAWDLVHKSIEMNGPIPLPRPSYYTPVFVNNPQEDVPMSWTAPSVGPTAEEQSAELKLAAYCAKPENIPPADPKYGPIGFDSSYRCKSSCFAPEVRVFFDKRYLTMKDAFDSRPPQISVVKEAATFENMAYELKDIKEWTSSIRSENYILREFSTANGRHFRVTQNHPLVTADGYFREAKDIGEGDFLVDANGQKELIVSAENQDYFGKVYNVQPEGESAKGNVIVAEGLLSGTAFVQNEGYEFINERVFRADLPSDIVK